MITVYKKLTLSVNIYKNIYLPFGNEVRGCNGEKQIELRLIISRMIMTGDKMAGMKERSK
jgi:hypothetical protein